MSVVVGYSPSSQGDAALAAALKEARRRGAGLVVASHAFHDPEAGRTSADESEVQAAIAAAAGGDEIPSFTVRRGQDLEVGDFLLQVAEEEGAQLLVVGLRQKSRIGKLNIGAAARRVVLASPCPVLAVKDAVPEPR